MEACLGCEGSCLEIQEKDPCLHRVGLRTRKCPTKRGDVSDPVERLWITGWELLWRVSLALDLF